MFSVGTVVKLVEPNTKVEREVRFEVIEAGRKPLVRLIDSTRRQLPTYRYPEEWLVAVSE